MRPVVVHNSSAPRFRTRVIGHDQGMTAEDPRLRLAFDEGQKALAQQRADLEIMRVRSITLVSTGAVAAGLIGGLPRDTFLYVDPRLITEDFVDRGTDIDGLLRQMANFAGASAQENERKLARLSYVYTAAVVTLGVLILTLTMAALTARKADSHGRPDPGVAPTSGSVAPASPQSVR